MNLEIINLFKKHYDNQCSSEELDRVMELFAAGTYQKEWDHILKEESQKVILENSQAEMSANEISNLHDRIMHSIGQHYPQTITLCKKKSSWKKIAVAASILLVASLGLYLYSRQSFNNQRQVAFQNDIAPGKNGATLTLANGQKILIKDALVGNIATQSGVKISKTADGQIIYEITNNNIDNIGFNTLSTTRGEQTRVRLPDGSLVFLNAASSLKYPTSFTSLKERKVELLGEGYFEIAKDKTHPFIVKTAKQEVEVLGTHFNINAYDDEPTIKTTLLEGSVKLSTNLQKEILKPNEQAILNNNQINIRTVENEEIVAWKNNEFLFKDDDFKANMRKIARWYDVEIVYESDALDKLRLGGFSSRSRNISEILKLMEKTGEVHFRIEGRKIHVRK